MLQYIVKLNRNNAAAVDTIRQHITCEQFQELPINEQTNFITNKLITHTLCDVENMEVITQTLGVDEV